MKEETVDRLNKMVEHSETMYSSAKIIHNSLSKLHHQHRNNIADIKGKGTAGSTAAAKSFLPKKGTAYNEYHKALLGFLNELHGLGQVIGADSTQLRKLKKSINTLEESTYNLETQAAEMLNKLKRLQRK